MHDKPMRRILVMELWGIGDVVMMSAVLAPLRKAYPQAEICVLCQDHGREVLGQNKEISRFHCFKFPWTVFHGKYFFWTWDWRGLWRTLRALRQEKFDLILDARGDPRNDLLSFMTGARMIVARAVEEQSRSLFHHDPFLRGVPKALRMPLRAMLMGMARFSRYCRKGMRGAYWTQWCSRDVPAIFETNK